MARKNTGFEFNKPIQGKLEKYNTTDNAIEQSYQLRSNTTQGKKIKSIDGSRICLKPLPNQYFRHQIFKSESVESLNQMFAVYYNELIYLTT